MCVFNLYLFDTSFEDSPSVFINLNPELHHAIFMQVFVLSTCNCSQIYKVGLAKIFIPVLNNNLTNQCQRDEHVCNTTGIGKVGKYKYLYANK